MLIKVKRIKWMSVQNQVNVVSFHIKKYRLPPKENHFLICSISLPEDPFSRLIWVQLFVAIDLLMLIRCIAADWEGIVAAQNAQIKTAWGRSQESNSKLKQYKFIEMKKSHLQNPISSSELATRNMSPKLTILGGISPSGITHSTLVLPTNKINNIYMRLRCGIKIGRNRC